jgi:hypothetical protein
MIRAVDTAVTVALGVSGALVYLLTLLGEGNGLAQLVPLMAMVKWEPQPKGEGDEPGG